MKCEVMQLQGTNIFTSAPMIPSHRATECWGHLTDSENASGQRIGGCKQQRDGYDDWRSPDTEGI